MYEMFTGRLPFDADTGVSVIMQHLHEQPEPPCSVNPEIPRGIEAIILKAMNKEQRLRYDNAKDILDDLIAVYRNPNIKLSMLHIDASELPQQRGGEPKKKRPPQEKENAHCALCRHNLHPAFGYGASVHRICPVLRYRARG